MNAQIKILDCGHSESPHSDITTGYGTDEHGKRHCYDCCAKSDHERMIKNGKIMLYLVPKKETNKFEIINWPGSLRFDVYYIHHSKRGGGFGSQRTDAYFTGPDGNRWHAVNRGNMDLVRCHRMKHAV